MPESSPKEKFVSELVGSILRDWESLLPPEVVQEIHEQVAIAESEAEAEAEAEAEPESRTVPSGTTPRPSSEE